MKCMIYGAEIGMVAGMPYPYLSLSQKYGESRVGITISSQQSYKSSFRHSFLLS